MIICAKLFSNPTMENEVWARHDSGTHKRTNENTHKQAHTHIYGQGKLYMPFNHFMVKS